MQQPGVPRSAYYPALDGLRAVAVLLVFVQHYATGPSFKFKGSWVLGWGWTGVDVFFVLSGFLITGILYDSQHRQHRYRDFYIRRTLRIFPLYYGLLALAVLAWPITHWQWDWRWSLWAVYLGNYSRFLFLYLPGNPLRFEWLSFGAPLSLRFSVPTHLFLGHFWSLCVEEQFYLLWPLAVYTVRKRETLMRICLGAVLLVPLLRFALTLTVPAPYLKNELLYRCLPTRADALLLGGLVALALRGKEQQLVRRLRRPVLLVSAAVLIVLLKLEVALTGVSVFDPSTNWVAVTGFSLVDLFAAALIVECIHPGSGLGNALSWRPLRALGMISYGFYVYHDLPHMLYDPLALKLSTAHGDLAVLGIAFVSAVVVATVSYLVLERPILRLKDRFTSQVHTAPQG